MKRTALLAALLAASCQTTTPPPMKTTTTSQDMVIAPDVAQRATQLPKTVIDYDRSLLNDNERQVIAKLIEASKQIDEIFWRQVSEDNPALGEKLAKPSAAYDYFVINRGPWDRLKNDEPFIGTKPKPPGAAFYPEDITKDEFEKYVAAHPAKKDELQGLFTVVRRDGVDLVGVPYSAFYKDFLDPAAARLREAAALTTNESLRSFLNKRADAFASNDYRDSDMAWMDLNGPIEIVIGPYEVYEDNLFNYKAAFELPNDEYVREKKGSKKVLLKNVMDAKFQKSGRPIALRVLDPALVGMLTFDAYFNHTLFHELSHGLGPGYIKQANGQRVEVRIPLKNLYSAIEECKADVLGLWNIRYAIEKKWLMSFDEQQLYVTYAGLMFRSMRFGIGEAHGRGTAVQWNWIREKGGVTPDASGKYTVDVEKFRAAVQSLATELLTIEATGDFNRANTLLTNYGKSTPEMEKVIGALKDIPVDITPVYP